MATEMVLEAMRNLYDACRKSGWTDTEFCNQFNVTKCWVEVRLKKTDSEKKLIRGEEND